MEGQRSKSGRQGYNYINQKTFAYWMERKALTFFFSNLGVIRGYPSNAGKMFMLFRQ
jgi:hypothetical protein